MSEGIGFGRVIPESLNKIDGAETDGLSGTSNSLSYRVEEIEKHFHSAGSWFEKATTADTTVHVADRIGGGIGAFQIDAGNDTWGAWVQILGSEDTPARTDMAYYDPHLILISAAERETVYFIQFARGLTTATDAYTAGMFTELCIGVDATRKFKNDTPVQTSRVPAGSMLWARCLAVGADTGTLDFYLGIHEYGG